MRTKRWKLTVPFMTLFRLIFQKFVYVNQFWSKSTQYHQLHLIPPTTVLIILPSTWVIHDVRNYASSRQLLKTFSSNWMSIDIYDSNLYLNQKQLIYIDHATQIMSDQNIYFSRQQIWWNSQSLSLQTSISQIISQRSLSLPIKYWRRIQWVYKDTFGKFDRIGNPSLK